MLKYIVYFYFCFNAVALDLISANIPFLSSESGKYFKLIERAAKQSGVELNVTFYPSERAKRNYFKKNFNGCILPKSILSEEYRDGIESIPFQRTKIYLFSRTKKIKSLDDVQNLRIGLVQGIDYGTDFKVLSDIKKNNLFLYALDTKTSLQLLHKKRVDIILGFLPMIKSASQELGKDVPSYASNYDLITIQDTLVCHSNSENLKGLMKINRELSHILNNTKQD